MIHYVIQHRSGSILGVTDTPDKADNIRKLGHQHLSGPISVELWEDENVLDSKTYNGQGVLSDHQKDDAPVKLPIPTSEK